MSAFMRAKMKVGTVLQFDGGERINCSAVGRTGSYPADGGDEDNTYAKYTPQGSLELTIANPALLGKIRPGDTFYLGSGLSRNRLRNRGTIMVTGHVLNGLLTKRAELAGEIERVQQTLRQLLIDLDSLDATIRMFDPEIDLELIKPKPLPVRSPAFRGEVSRVVLATLRKAGRPLPNHEITLAVMASRSLNPADKPLLRVLSKRVGACLRMHRKSGLVRAVDGPNRNLLWEIAP